MALCRQSTFTIAITPSKTDSPDYTLNRNHFKRFDIPVSAFRRARFSVLDARPIQLPAPVREARAPSGLSSGIGGRQDAVIPSQRQTATSASFKLDIQGSYSPVRNGAMTPSWYTAAARPVPGTRYPVTSGREQ